MEEKKFEDGMRESESDLEKTVESRITAGPISNVVSPNFVTREGFAYIYGVSKKIKKGEYKNYFEIYLDDGCYFDDVAVKVEDNCRSLFCIPELNIGLNKDGLYIAHFQSALPPYYNDRGDLVVGCGDVYSDKDISVDEKGNLKEVLAVK